MKHLHKVDGSNRGLYNRSYRINLIRYHLVIFLTIYDISGLHDTARGTINEEKCQEKFLIFKSTLEK